ncbi:MAG: 3-keto-5-aminohexanoate cleavage protein [Pseudonocardia sp.]
MLLHGEDSSAWSVWRYATETGLGNRIGLEDVLARPDGSPTRGNADLVEHAQQIRPGGLPDAASPGVARLR